MAGWLFKAKEAREPKCGSSAARSASGSRSTSGTRRPASAAGGGGGGGTSNTAVRPLLARAP
jgi:hypothetical protein